MWLLYIQIVRSWGRDDFIDSLGVAFWRHTGPGITHEGIKARQVPLVPVSLKAGLTVRSMSCGGFFFSRELRDLSGDIYPPTKIRT